MQRWFGSACFIIAWATEKNGPDKFCFMESNTYMRANVSKAPEEREKTTENLSCPVVPVKRPTVRDRVASPCMLSETWSPREKGDVAWGCPSLALFARLCLVAVLATQYSGSSVVFAQVVGRGLITLVAAATTSERSAADPSRRNCKRIFLDRAQVISSDGE